MNSSKFLNDLTWPRLDFDAKAFVNFSGITDPKIIRSINDHVVQLKRFGLWSKLDAIYPFVGADVQPCSINLKNPSAFKLIQSGTITYDFTGVTGNGTTGFFNTQYSIPVSRQDSFSMGVHCRNNVQGSYCAMGTTTNNASAFTQMFLRQSGAGNALEAEINQTAMINTFNNTNSQGFYIGARTASNVVATYKNGVSVVSDTDASVTPSTAPINILARNSTPPGTRGPFAIYNLSYAFMGAGLTAAEALIFNQIVQQFQVSLSRAV